jgi:hypothetical protein
LTIRVQGLRFSRGGMTDIFMELYVHAGDWIDACIHTYIHTQSFVEHMCMQVTGSMHVYINTHVFGVHVHAGDGINSYVQAGTHVFVQCVCTYIHMYLWGTCACR